MTIGRKIFDIFGQGDRKFYARDFRNAYQFRPDVNPPRQQFEGYVNFVLNRDLYEQFFQEQGKEFRVQISSLVRNASLPSLQLRTETKNQYNRKKIINTTTEFQPVNITVMDTVGNEWLTLLMKYYTYHYMNARNEGTGTRDVGQAPDLTTSTDFVNSFFGNRAGWNSNKYGYNVNTTPYFFERIDYVLYHGNKGVQYSLLNPVLTDIKTSDIDYAESSLMEFDLTFEYENFTVFDQLNFDLTEFDTGRFEPADEFTGAAFSEGRKPLALTGDPIILDILGDADFARNRSVQPQPPGGIVEATDAPAANVAAEAALNDVSPADVSGTGDQQTTPTDTVTEQTSRFPSTYGTAAKFAGKTDQRKSSFLGGLLGNVADAALSAAINGVSIKDAALTTAIGGVLNEIEPRLTTIGQSLTRPEPNRGNDSSSTVPAPQPQQQTPSEDPE